MKNKKGFTLIELMAILVLLSLVSVLALVAVSSIKSKVQQRQYFNLASKIETAAETYSNDKGIKKMFVQTLIDAGVIEADDESKYIHDPRDKGNTLNCHIVSMINGEAFLEDENTDCSAKVLSDDSLIVMYCLESDPNCVPAPLTDEWHKENVVLYVFPAIPDTLSLDGADYRWVSPLAPDEVFLTKENTYTVNSDRVNDMYQVTVSVDGVDYNAYADIKIDKVNPRVYDLYDKDPENWSAKKEITFKLSDNESGLKKYGFSTGIDVIPTEWIEIEGGKNNDTFSKSFDFTGQGTSAELYIWVEDMAGNSNSDEISSSGLKINNIDGEGADRIGLTKNTEEIVKEVTLTGTAQDDKSGLVAYSFGPGTAGIKANDSGWTTFRKTNDEVKHDYKVKAKGDYFYCVKDAVNNVSCTTIYVGNIDDRIDYVYVSNDTYGYTDRVTLTGYMQDYESGIVGYTFTTSSSTPSRFTPVTKTNDYLTYTYTATSNGTYYLWVTDALGNVDKSSVYVNNIARKYTKTYDLYSEYDSYIANNYYISGLKEVINYYSNDGYASAYPSGNYLYVSAYSGTARYGSRATTCTAYPNSYYANSYQVCSYYYCPYGGSLSGTMCVPPRGNSYTLYGNSYTVYCSCSGGSWRCPDSGTTTYCDSGYSRDFNDYYACSPSAPTGSCSAGAATSYSKSCRSTCYWNGPSAYSATCGNSYTQYNCPYGGTLSGYYCYQCSVGSYNSYTGLCQYGCSESYTFWRYTVTVEYYAD